MVLSLLLCCWCPELLAWERWKRKTESHWMGL